MKSLLLLLALTSPLCAQQMPSLSAAQEQLRSVSRGVSINAFAQPRYDLQCVLTGVLAIMNLSVRPQIPLPALYLQDKTPLKQFQDAVEPQWQTRPKRFYNAYAGERNEIYIITEADYYRRLRRFVDDSIAHELAHYVQVKYKNIGAQQLDVSLENEAVALQTEFRDRYMKTGISPCAAEF